jgi:hypothetical protein
MGGSVEFHRTVESRVDIEDHEPFALIYESMAFKADIRPQAQREPEGQELGSIAFCVSGIKVRSNDFMSAILDSKNEISARLADEAGSIR